MPVLSSQRDSAQAPSCACSVAPRRLMLVAPDLLFLPSDLLSWAVERERVFSPKPCLVSAETSRLIVSIEDVLSTELGSVSPSSCQRIFALWTDFFFFFPGLRSFQTEFIENSFWEGVRLWSGGT